MNQSRCCSSDKGYEPASARRGMLCLFTRLFFSLSRAESSASFSGDRASMRSDISLIFFILCSCGREPTSSLEDANGRVTLVEVRKESLQEAAQNFVKKFSITHIA